MDPKIGCWAAGGVGGIAMVLNFIYCTNLDNYSLIFRPEIGFENFKVGYGYNAILSK